MLVWWYTNKGKGNTMNEFLVCTDCLVGLVNDDWTATDDDAAIAAAAESLGWVTHDRTEDHGVFRCYVCSEDHYGAAEVVAAA